MLQTFSPTHTASLCRELVVGMNFPLLWAFKPFSRIKGSEAATAAYPFPVLAAKFFPHPWTAVAVMVRTL
jgi:hypothetical protein